MRINLVSHDGHLTFLMTNPNPSSLRDLSWPPSIAVASSLSYALAEESMSLLTITRCLSLSPISLFTELHTALYCVYVCISMV